MNRCFQSYRNVPWLGPAPMAVTMVPSAIGVAKPCANCPPGKASRQDLVAFGDPYFSKEQGPIDAAKGDKPVQLG